MTAVFFFPVRVFDRWVCLVEDVYARPLDSLFHHLHIDLVEDVFSARLLDS